MPQQKVTLTTIQQAAPVRLSSNAVLRATSLLGRIAQYGHAAGLTSPRAQVHFLAQTTHESGWFQFAEEIWGPTAQQLRYEADPAQPFTSTNYRNKLAYTLGNTEPGDGYRFRGRDAIQNTGRYNYRLFTGWVRALDPRAPDFEAAPDMLLDPAWFGLAAIWYWQRHDITARIEPWDDLLRPTKIINGGQNGLADRRGNFARLGAVVLGYDGIDDYSVRAIQRRAGIVVDGSLGPNTRAAIHNLLDNTAPAAVLRPMARPVGLTLGGLFGRLFGKAIPA